MKLNRGYLILIFQSCNTDAAGFCLWYWDEDMANCDSYHFILKEQQ